MQSSLRCQELGAIGCRRRREWRRHGMTVSAFTDRSDISVCRPSPLMIQMSVLPATPSCMKAMEWPSGDHCGCTPGARRRKRAPSGRTVATHRSLVASSNVLNRMLVPAGDHDGIRSRMQRLAAQSHRRSPQRCSTAGCRWVPRRCVARRRSAAHRASSCPVQRPAPSSAHGVCRRRRSRRRPWRRSQSIRSAGFVRRGRRPRAVAGRLDAGRCRRRS